MKDDFLIILLFIMKKGNDNSVLDMSTVELDNKNTINKVKTLKEIGPYLPENYIPLINKSISFAERFIKINELSALFQKEEEIYISEHIPMKSEERMKKIVSILHKESMNYKKGQMGQIMDLVLNMEKYEKMFGAFNTVMGNPNVLNDPLELINLMGPLLGGGKEDSGAKFKEISKMMKLMKLLDTPKKEANQK